MMIITKKPKRLEEKPAPVPLHTVTRRLKAGIAEPELEVHYQAMTR
jgi:hypothetical protein